MKKALIVNFRPGDLVVKAGHYDKGKLGLVVTACLFTAGGAKILEVLCEGKLTRWYSGTVRLANEKDRLGESKRRTQE